MSFLISMRCSMWKLPPVKMVTCGGKTQKMSSSLCLSPCLCLVTIFLCMLANVASVIYIVVPFLKTMRDYLIYGSFFLGYRKKEKLMYWGHTRFDVFACTPDGESMKKDPEEPWERSKVYYWQGIGGVVIVQQRRDATLLLTITCKLRRKNHSLQKGCTRWRQDTERYVKDKNWLKTL